MRAPGELSQEGSDTEWARPACCGQESGTGMRCGRLLRNEARWLDALQEAIGIRRHQQAFARSIDREFGIAIHEFVDGPPRDPVPSRSEADSH